MGLITVVCWRWGSKYGKEHIAKLQSMLARNLSIPHELVCITDRRDDLPVGVRPFQMPRTPMKDWKCIRRMWLYSYEASKIGKRILQLDVDMVLTGSIDPIVDRPEPFVIWKSESNFGEKWAYNATVMLLNAGARSDVWDRWVKDPRGSCKAAAAAGLNPRVNSDQAIATYYLKDNPPATWTTDDGIYAYRVIAGKHGMKDHGLPENARIVSFHGSSKGGPVRDPSNSELYERSPWVKEHWR